MEMMRPVTLSPKDIMLSSSKEPKGRGAKRVITACHEDRDKL
jgi:hypothetical protein